MTPDLPALCFLVYVFVALPWAALQSARRLRLPEVEGRPRPSRPKVFAGTLVALAMMFALSFMNARAYGVNLFFTPPIGVREAGLATVALGVLLAMIPVTRAVRSESERRRMAVLGFTPRTGREWALFTLTAAGAGIAEESAYRGVAIWILAPILGFLPAAVLSATAFAVSHVMQGAKSMVVVFVIGLVCQGLVYFSGTLVLAMVVHATYDMIAAWLVSRMAQRYELEDARAASSA